MHHGGPQTLFERVLGIGSTVRGIHMPPFTFDMRYTTLYTGTVPKQLTAVRLKPEQIKKLETIATREDVPVSWLIRKAIDAFLKHKK